MAGHSSFCNQIGAGTQWITCWDSPKTSLANGCGQWHRVLVSQSAASAARKRSSPDWGTSCEHSCPLLKKRQWLTTNIQCQRVISQPPTRQSNACCTVTCRIGHKTHRRSCWKPLDSHYYSFLVVHWGESHACCCCAMVWCHTESLQAQDHRQHLPRIGSAATTSCCKLPTVQHQRDFTQLLKSCGQKTTGCSRALMRWSSISNEPMPFSIASFRRSLQIG